MVIDDRVRAIALALTNRVGAKLIERLLAHFGSYEAILSADVTALRRVSGIGPQISASIRAIKVEQVAHDLQRFSASGISTTLWNEAAFPAALAALPDHPLVVFMRGTYTDDDQRAVAIVGTREASSAGLELTAWWAREFAKAGYTVISGLARGIDTQAHQQALAAGGRSIAVLGGGINRVYPPENAALAIEVHTAGAVMCEVHPDVNPAPNALVMRNRLITGLSRAVLVMECGVDSGAMDAARRANAQGRPVYATANSPGTRHLLATFARPLPESVDALLTQIRL